MVKPNRCGVIVTDVGYLLACLTESCNALNRADENYRSLGFNLAVSLREGLECGCGCETVIIVLAACVVYIEYVVACGEILIGCRVDKVSVERCIRRKICYIKRRRIKLICVVVILRPTDNLFAFGCKAFRRIFRLLL